MPIEYVSDAATLSSLCEQWMGEEFLAVDTEFERTNTFYARIGLLQIADKECCYIVDPLTIDDWSAFKHLLTASGCTLVMHSCSEDLSLLQTFLGCLPTSLFDTQLAAAFLGLGFSISYQAMVEQLLEIEVAKDETRSDWIRRPLSEKQIQYAAADVRYLLQIRKLLSDQIDARGMADWMRADCEQQLKQARKLEEESQWQSYYVGVSNAWKLNEEGLQALQQLCVWREQTARKRNKPRSWIVKDNDLLKLCIELSAVLKAGDLSVDHISSVEAIDRRFLARNAKELHSLLSDSSSGTKADPSLLNRPLSTSLRKKLKLTKQAANSKAEEMGMSPELLGRKKFLVELLKDYDTTGALTWSGELAGWRRELLEADIDAILEKG